MEFSNHKIATIAHTVTVRTVALAVLLLFVLAQYATVSHAAEHPFHHDEVDCQAFVVAEKSKTHSSACSLPVGQLLLSDEVVNDHNIIEKNRFSSLAYLSRAPPAYIV